jgi:hypothetical protein
MAMGLKDENQGYQNAKGRTVTVMIQMRFSSGLVSVSLLRITRSSPDFLQPRKRDSSGRSTIPWQIGHLNIKNTCRV